MAEILSFIYRQLFVSLPYPTQSWQGKTVIVTGSNIGLGKEAARHLTRLGAAKVILAVRSEGKGEAAKEEILSTTKAATGDKGVIEVWPLDLSSYDSVKAFAKRVDSTVTRLDAVLLNAAIATTEYRTEECDEATLTVNVTSTLLLLLLLLPVLKRSAAQYNIRPTIALVSSEVHGWAKFAEQDAPDGKIFETLSNEKTANMEERYPLSKLLEVLAVRAIAERKPADKFPVTINYLNPGFCHSELARDLQSVQMKVMKLLLARTTEVGSRTLVHAAGAGPETHGMYLSDCRITPPSPFVLSAKGHQVQERVWKELVAKLEKIQPGVLGNL